MEDHKKIFFTQMLIKVDIDMVKTSFESRHGSLHGGHHQHESQLHGSEKINFEGRESHVGRGENHWGQQPNNDSNCYYYGKHGHMAKKLLSKGT
jgi:hypothetical protein